MNFNELTKGYRIDYKFETVTTQGTEEEGQVERTTTQYATSPVYEKKMQLNQKLTELDEREDVVEIVVTGVHFKKK